MRPIASVVLLSVFATSVVCAHHSSVQFDLSKTIALVGTLVQVDWRNPHVTVSIRTDGSAGSIETWVLESGAPAWFRGRSAGRSDFEKSVGQTVMAEGVPAKDGSLFGYLYKITLADGRSLDLR